MSGLHLYISLYLPNLCNLCHQVVTKHAHISVYLPVTQLLTWFFAFDCSILIMFICCQMGLTLFSITGHAYIKARSWINSVPSWHSLLQCHYHKITSEASSTYVDKLDDIKEFGWLFRDTGNAMIVLHWGSCKWTIANGHLWYVWVASTQSLWLE